MGRVVDILVRDLQDLLGQVGRDGGRIGPSVYDTAMVARLAPPEGGPEPALDWLLSQQQADGGWCSPRYPIGRDLPTLAAVLALRALRSDARSREACAAGLAFLRAQSAQWTSIPDDLPIALELTLPALVEEAIRSGVDISPEPYRLLAAEGERKRRYVAKTVLVAGAPVTYAWESLGVEPTADVVDRMGGVGTSPSATAAWWRASSGQPGLHAARETAAGYLRRAAAATGSGIPGVCPVVFPVERFEQSWSALAVVSSGLLGIAPLKAALQAPLASLRAAARDGRWSYSDLFVVDGDDTACSLAVLKAAGFDVDTAGLRSFEASDRFLVHPGERNPSLSANAHALYALSLFGEDSPASRAFLVGRQASDGRFLDEKFHASWLYITHRAILALRPDDEALRAVRAALLAQQRADGGFGASAGEDDSETAYGLLSLRELRRKGLGGTDVEAAIERAYHLLTSRYRPFAPGTAPLWIGKELYGMLRVDRVFVLSAMLSTALEVEG